jgi:hypothetical protein
MPRTGGRSRVDGISLLIVTPSLRGDQPMCRAGVG